MIIRLIAGFLLMLCSTSYAQPAFEGEQEGEYFVSLQASVYKAYIVKLNYSCYNSKLPKSSPQDITIIQYYGMDKDDNGNRFYSCEKFYKALNSMKIFDLLTQKLKPMIVQ
jgi:hypothetical protein